MTKLRSMQSDYQHFLRLHNIHVNSRREVSMGVEDGELRVGIRSALGHLARKTSEQQRMWEGGR